MSAGVSLVSFFSSNAVAGDQTILRGPMDAGHSYPPPTSNSRQDGENRAIQHQLSEAHQELSLWDIPACRPAGLFRRSESCSRNISAKSTTGRGDSRLFP